MGEKRKEKHKRRPKPHQASKGSPENCYQTGSIRPPARSDGPRMWSRRRD